MAHAAPDSGLRYFEGEILIEKTAGQESCQRHIGKTREVQLSLQETRKGQESHITGWIIFAGGAPGKLEGPLPTQLTVTTNHHDAYLNTPTTLALEIADAKVTGILRETPPSLSFGDGMCYWQTARLTLTEKTDGTDISPKLREHAAWYKAYAHESRGNYHARYDQFAEAAVAHDQAIAEVDGVLPEALAFFKGLLANAAHFYANAKDYERAAQRYQRLMDIKVRRSEIGAEDTGLYHGWVQLATYLHLAKRTDETITVIERAARLEDKKEVDLDDRLWRRRLQGNIYLAAKMFDKAQTSLQDEVSLATAEAGPNDTRTFEARVQAARVLRAMNEDARFEAAFEPLAKEITARFGESHTLARDSNRLLGMHYYSTDAEEKARPWLEKAFRGHQALVNSTVQAVRENDEAKSILASLLDIYMKQGIVAKDFLDQVKAGQASLDDLPFRESLANGLEPSTAAKNNFREWDKLLMR